MTNDKPPELYLINDAVYSKASPSGTVNLTKLYGLRELANSVARFDPVTNEKHKLRKSYKNHIADLSGKHTIPTAGSNSRGHSWSLLELARQPPRYDDDRSSVPPPLQPPLDPSSLSYALNFDKAPATGIPDFDVSLLAAGGFQPQPQPVHNNGIKRDSGMGTGADSSNDDGNAKLRKSKKKKRKESINNELYDGNDSDAKRRKT